MWVCGEGEVGVKGRKVVSRAERGTGVVLLEVVLLRLVLLRLALFVLEHWDVSAWRGSRAVEAVERMAVRTVSVGVKCMVS